MRKEDPAEAYSPGRMGRAMDAYGRAVLRAMPVAFVGVLFVVVVCLLLKIDRLVSAFIATTGMFAIYFWRARRELRAVCQAGREERVRAHERRRSN